MPHIPLRALVIDDEPDIGDLLKMTLEAMDIATDCVQQLGSAKQHLMQNTYDLVITDLRLPDGDGLAMLDYLHENHPSIPCAMITAHGSMELAIEALKKGAFDFITKPIDLHQFRQLINDAINIPQKVDDTLLNRLSGSSDAIEAVKKSIVQLAKSQAPVHIQGESGVGKELAAKMIHQFSARKDQPFIAVNCGAIPTELMESEFFGHKKGSFTGADRDTPGFFQAADHGTLFLDEIADLPLSMQVKLLRTLQEKTIRVIGETKERPVDVRIISATHKNLQALVDAQSFRQDLYYRINVIELNMPSLSERLDDLPMLVKDLLHKLCKNNQRPVPKVDQASLLELKTYPFPGNIRELENMIERALALSEDDTIQLFAPLKETMHIEATFDHQNQKLDDYMHDVERQAILTTLEKTGGNKTQAAKELGLTFRAFRYRLKKLGLDQ